MQKEGKLVQLRNGRPACTEPGFITQGQKIKKGAGEGLPKDDCLLQKQ